MTEAAEQVIEQTETLAQMRSTQMVLESAEFYSQRERQMAIDCYQRTRLMADTISEAICRLFDDCYDADDFVAVVDKLRSGQVPKALTEVTR